MRNREKVKEELDYVADCDWDEFRDIDIPNNLLEGSWNGYCDTIFNRVDLEGSFVYDSAARVLDLVYWEEKSGE